MARKISAFFTLAAFALFSTSCMTWRATEVRTMPRPLPENTAVASIVLNTGRVIEFSKSAPGRVRGFSVVGTGRDPVAKQVDIEGPFSFTRDETGLITGVVDGKGQAYVVKKILSKDERTMTLVAWASNQVSIPLAEIATVKVRKTNTLMTSLAVIGGLAVIVVIFGYILISLE